MLIGRGDSLAKLSNELDAAWKGRGRTAMIMGEAGVGKTRLVEELAARAERLGGWTLIGRCYESAQVLPFGPWVDALRAWRRSGRGPDPGELAPVWRAELARLLPELGHGATPRAAVRDHLRLFEALSAWVVELGARGPTLLVIEDLHWADELSQRFMAFVSRRIDASRVLLIGTARDEELPSGSLPRRVLAEIRQQTGALNIPLVPLSREDTGRLVRALVGTRAAGSDSNRLEEQVWRLSEGNPFTILETLRALREGRDTASSLTELAVPERVREMIQGRVAQLPERERQAMALASVIGREFDLALLARAAGLSDVRAGETAETLRQRRLLVSRGERLDVTHDRIREAIVADLLPAQRKLLHRAVGRAIEELYADDLGAHRAVLGAHYREGEIWDKAVEHLQQAGRSALDHAAHREALTLFEQAIAGLGHLPTTRDRIEQACDLRFDIRHALFPLAERRQILTRLREAEALAESLGDPRRIAELDSLMATEEWLRGDQSAALARARRSRAAGQRLGVRELELIAALRLGQIHHTLGEYRQGADVLRGAIFSLEGTERFVILPITPLYPLCCGWLAWNLSELGDFDEAIARGREGLAIVESEKNPYGIAHACFNLGRAYLQKGELAAAHEVLERGLDVCRARDLPTLSLINSGECGYVLVLSGRLVDGVDMLASTVQHMEVAGVEFTRALHLAWLAEGWALAGRPDHGLETARRALELAVSRGEQGHEAHARRALGEIGARGPDAEAAEPHYAAALDLATSLGMRPLIAHCHLGLGKLARHHGDQASAARHLSEARALFGEMNMRRWDEEAGSELTALG